MPAKSLSKESFMELWQKELLPSIRKEIKLESELIMNNIRELKEKCMQIEKSQEFLSAKYEQLMQSIQSTKKQVDIATNKMKHQEESISSLKDNTDELYFLVDELQQYSRRDCIEINGIPKLEGENANQIVIEISSLIGVQLSQEDISIAHRLPDTRKVKDRIIAKLVRRDKKDEIYKNRRKLQKKTNKDIPSVASSLKGKPGRIHINESLTSYRRRLLGKINSFKKENHYKFLWTQNGKILLKQSETSSTYAFTTDGEFEEFLTST